MIFYFLHPKDSKLLQKHHDSIILQIKPKINDKLTKYSLKLTKLQVNNNKPQILNPLIIWIFYGALAVNFETNSVRTCVVIAV